MCRLNRWIGLASFVGLLAGTALAPLHAKPPRDAKGRPVFGRLEADKPRDAKHLASIFAGWFDLRSEPRADAR